MPGTSDGLWGLTTGHQVWVASIYPLSYLTRSVMYILNTFSVAAAAAPSRQGRTALVTSARGGVAGWRGVGGAEGGG